MRVRTLKRILQTVSIDPSAVDRIDTIAGETGLSRGRVIEAALATIQACGYCDGQGRIEPTRQAVRNGECGPDGTCGNCYGSRVEKRS